MKTTFILLFVLTQYFSYSQNIPEKFVAALDSFSLNRPQEKTYLQTDRESYISGETIWFKIFATLNEKPTILSRVIYVELVNATGELLEKKMLKLKEGTANGTIEIKTTLPSGNYYLRSYTLWMLNFPAFISEKKITIITGTQFDKKAKNNIAPPDIAVSFFPEGGNLVTGLKSNVAFKAIDENGSPLIISGNIINSKNEKVASLVTVHDGMGNFELLPVEGETYKAIIQYGNAKQKIVLLPAANAEGIVLYADNSNTNKTFVKVERSEKNKPLYNNLLVVVQINYQVAYMGKLNIDEGQDAVAINKKTLRPGIMQITVLTEDGKPLAERIVFVSNHTISNDLLHGNLISTEKRKKNIIAVDLSVYKNLQAAIAVTNAAANSSTSNSTILSTLLLSSDIRGDINNPGFYFKDKEVTTLQYLDLIMLTNGWRRYNLGDIMQNKYSQLHYPFETGLSVTGKVLQSDGKTVLKSGRINLIIKGEDSSTIMSQANTNAAAAFIVDNIEYKKEATIYYQGTNTNKTEGLVAVNFNPSFFDTLKKMAPGYNQKLFTDSFTLSVYLNQLLAEKLKSDSLSGKTLQEVVVKSKKRSVTDSLNSLYASDYFLESDQTLVLNENINYYDVWQFLQGMVPGIRINKTDTGTQVNFSRYEGLDFFSENGQDNGVQFFLNEVAVNVDVIDFLTPGDIGLIKIYKGTTAIALGASRGAIAIYTVKGKSFNDWRKKGFDYFKKLGYSVNKEFFNMDYSKLNPESSFSDIRTTLYWNPEVKITDGKATIEFYNDDVCKKFKVVIEGIDANGKLLYAEKEIQ